MYLCIDNNLACLSKILKYNLQHNLMFFRITFDLLPFSSNPVCTFPWQVAYASSFRELGYFIKAKWMRVALHPDQFVLINTPNEDIYERRVRKLFYQAEVLDMVDINEKAKIQIPIGGVYQDKAKSIRRFIERYQKLPDKMKKKVGD